MLISLNCGHCGTPFQFDSQTFNALQLRSLPTHCPTCNDRRQHKPPQFVVTNRSLINEWVCNVQLPHDWFEEYLSHDNDRPCLRAIVKGADLHNGVAWDGRLDIYCLSSEVPSVARVRLMTVTHERGHERYEQGTMRKYENSYEYLVIEPTEEVPTADLVFAKVSYKTTLKGFGRQWYASLDTSTALWAQRFSSSARSGRFGTYACVAVVNKDHPIYLMQSGDRKQDLYIPHRENIDHANE